MSSQLKWVTCITLQSTYIALYLNSLRDDNECVERGKGKADNRSQIMGITASLSHIHNLISPVETINSRWHCQWYMKDQMYIELRSFTIILPCMLALFPLKLYLYIVSLILLVMALGGTARCPVYTGWLATSDGGGSARGAVVLHGGEECGKAS